MFLILFVLNFLSVYSASVRFDQVGTTNCNNKKITSIEDYETLMQNCIINVNQGKFNENLVKEIFDATNYLYNKVISIQNIYVRAEMKDKMRKIYEKFYEAITSEQEAEQPQLYEHINQLKHALTNINNWELSKQTADSIMKRAYEDFNNYYGVSSED